MATVSAELLKAFQLFDKDGSGSVAGGELKYILSTMGERLSESEVGLSTFSAIFIYLLNCLPPGFRGHQGSWLHR